MISADPQPNEKCNTLRSLIGPSSATRAANRAVEQQFNLARLREEEATEEAAEVEAKRQREVGGGSEVCERLWKIIDFLYIRASCFPMRMSF